LIEVLLFLTFGALIVPSQAPFQLIFWITKVNGSKLNYGLIFCFLTLLALWLVFKFWEMEIPFFFLAHD